MNHSGMPRVAIAGLATVFLLIAGCASHPSAAAAPGVVASEAEAAAIAAVDGFQAALVAGDFERAAEVLDPDVVVLESGGAEFSASEYLAGHAKSDAEFLKSAEITPRHRRARVSGDLAWVASLIEMEIQQDGKPVTVDGAESMVLRRGPSGWKIVHIHWSSRIRR